MIINSVQSQVSIQIPHNEEPVVTPVGSLELASTFVLPTAAAAAAPAAAAAAAAAPAAAAVSTSHHLIKPQLSVDSAMVTAMEQRQSRLARPVPTASDLHNLEQELSKITVRSTPVLPQPVSSIPHTVPLLTTVVATPSTESLLVSQEFPPVEDMSPPSPKPVVRKVSRFQVSAVQEDPSAVTHSPSHSNSSAGYMFLTVGSYLQDVGSAVLQLIHSVCSFFERREERRGRFSVVTQDAPSLHLLHMNPGLPSPSSTQSAGQPVRRITATGIPVAVSRVREEARMSRWPSEGHIRVSDKQPKHLLRDKLKNAHSMIELATAPLSVSRCHSVIYPLYVADDTEHSQLFDASSEELKALLSR
ncbi:hypothetical protein J6590_004985 [Homalodisca vitripennis]|nr:hypothetical protein J6590_004985 [Homalodisca vitripennis]